MAKKHTPKPKPTEPVNGVKSNENDTTDSLDHNSIKGHYEEEIEEIEDEIEEVSPEFSKLPDQDKKAITRRFVEHMEMHSGPIPSPDVISKYNGIIPNGADRIMTMAEKEQDHRITSESKLIDGQVKALNKGQDYALIISIVGIICGTIATVLGYPVFGSSMAGGSVVIIAAGFINGKIKQRKQSEKEEE